MPDLSNESKLREILKQGAPELYAVMEAMEETQIDQATLIKGLFLLKNIQRFSRWGKVTFLVQDGQIVRVEQTQGFKTEM